MVMVYDRERIQIKSAKEKGTRGKLQEKPGTSFQVSPVDGVTWGLFIPPRMMHDNTCMVLPSREVHSSLGIQVFTESQSCRHAAPTGPGFLKPCTLILPSLNYLGTFAKNKSVHLLVNF